MPQEARASTRPAIVGIGASAGGVRALQAFFEALPADTGAAFVVIVHLDPQSRSDLSSILATRTRMPVAQVEASAKLRANHVYVIPPDRRLQISDHEISASEFDEPRGQRAPIDLFFRSLARQHGDGFAVILTGAGSDGAIGVAAVKEAGGIILVQEPSEAEYPSMPRSAIGTGIADFVLPVRELAARLVELVHNKENLSTVEAGHFDEEVLRRILVHLRVRTGHDFARYKRSTIVRRITRRMQVTRSENLSEYYIFLRDNAEEAQALLGDLLISVTTFFRDSETFEALKAKVLPYLFRGREPGSTIRVWVPGCATGEEAYTIAMLLIEEATRHDHRPVLQVFGSDLDARALAIAREGRYPAAIEADVSEERLRRFFSREGDHYRVRRELRDIVLFASHSLLKDPPFSRVDLISCRNLLIYLDRELQQQACSTFHYALNPEGYLLLGSSETADNPPGLFVNIERKSRIYQSTVRLGDKPRLLPRLLGGLGTHEPGLQTARPLSPGAALNEAALHRKALEKVAPPSALVDDAHRVVHLSENAGRYIRPSAGPLSGNLVDLVRPELRFELSSALNRVFEQRQPTLTLPILLRFDGSPHRVHLQVKPVEEVEAAKPRGALVLFIEGEAVHELPASSADDQHATDETVRRLTEELQLTQSRMRTTREESEAANEELRAANEELQSINEEYRSTSEELETSKEELQSINEELQTVNSELKLKLDVVSRAHSDLQNLMAATEIGTLFLDPGLRIKRFTEQVTELFRITPSDEGRVVTDFAHRLEYDDLVKDSQAVLAHLAPIRREVRSRDRRWYEVRLRPYRTIDDKIDGVVITFVDVTERRQVEHALRESEQKLQSVKRLVELSHDPIFIWDFDGGVVEWNRGSEELYGYSREEAFGKKKEQLLGTIVPGASFHSLKEQLLRDRKWAGVLKQRTKDGRELTIESRIVLETIEGRRMALESTRDITERNHWENRQKLLLGELTHRVKNTLAVVQAIAHQSLRNSGSNKDFIERFEGRLSALAASHGLLVASDWKGADLGALARNQLEPYVLDDKERLHIGGEAVILPADLATPFGLVLHELATNAVKHGSLSRPDGKVEVSWTVKSGNGERRLIVLWRETGSPPGKIRGARGLGSALIESGIPNAMVNREFGPDGLVCTIELPLPEAEEDGAMRRS
ncbi:MAG: PAS domain-containing protein [Hyphomicrobiales bacterium]|nr:PAS domain-containing protein [Hyphomicrobiales bacterium]MBV9516695.1 PAS domain-containing protein [Hyphomicrobiales bacterium]